jgi:hypothetical protein
MSCLFFQVALGAALRISSMVKFRREVSVATADVVAVPVDEAPLDKQQGLRVSRSSEIRAALAAVSNPASEIPSAEAAAGEAAHP